MQKEKYWRGTRRRPERCGLKILELRCCCDAMLMYLREAADEARGSAGGPVQAVVEEQSVTDGHVLQSEVELSHDAGPQVGAATGELHVWGGRGRSFC